MSDGLSIIIPALNEELGIGATLEAVKAMADTLDRPVEIIVVNDGSTDRTAEIAAEYGAIVISHPARGGYGHALKTGIRNAQHELIAITDADGTYPVAEIPRLVEKSEDFDLVIGSRTGRHYMRHLLLSPMRTSFLLLTNFVTGEWINDPNSGLRVFKRADVMPILDRLPTAFSFTTTQTLIMTLEHRFVHHHPIVYAERLGRSKIRPVRDALRVGQTLIEVMLHYNPLKIFLLVAIVMMVPGLLAVLTADTTGVTIAGMLMFCSGVLVFGVGMAAVTFQQRD